MCVKTSAPPQLEGQADISKKARYGKASQVVWTNIAVNRQANKVVIASQNDIVCRVWGN